MPILDPMKLNRATSAQIQYLEVLFTDCGFTTRIMRNDFLSVRTRRAIRYLDDLTKVEASQFIEELRKQKEELKQSADHSSNSSRSVDDEEDGSGEISREDV